MVNRVLAVLLALAVVALGVLVPVEITRAAAGKRHWLLPWETLTTTLTGNSWQSGPVRAVLIGVAAIGLLLLLFQLTPRRLSALPLAPLTAGVEASTTRRSLRQALQRAATEVDGVSSAKAKVGRRRAKITARTELRDAGDLQQQVSEHVAHRLDSLSLARAPQVAVRLRRKETQ